MFCILKQEVNNDTQPIKGIIVFQDDDCMLPSPEISPIEVWSQHAPVVVKCNSGTPVAFMENKSDMVFKIDCFQGHFRRGNNGKVLFRARDSTGPRGEVEFSELEKENEDVAGKALLAGKSFHSLTWSGSGPDISEWSKSSDTDILTRRDCLQNWIAELILSRFFVTEAFVTLCQKTAFKVVRT